MIRYTDADNILYKDLSEGRGVCWVTFKDWIDEMPTADVVEVVRCQDCRHFDTGYCGIPFIGKKVNPNHYCSFGERKEESGDEDDIPPHVCSTCHWCLNDWHQEPCNICAHGSKWKDGR